MLIPRSLGVSAPGLFLVLKPLQARPLRAEALGRTVEPCHLRSMAEGDSPQRKKGSPKPAEQPLSREEKLAQALRDNLKRRKAKKD